MLAIELGGYCGYSAIRIGRLLPPGAKFYSLEINPLFACYATKLVELAGLKDVVTVKVGRARYDAPVLVSVGTAVTQGVVCAVLAVCGVDGVAD